MEVTAYIKLGSLAHQPASQPKLNLPKGMTGVSIA